MRNSTLLKTTLFLVASAFTTATFAAESVELPQKLKSNNAKTIGRISQKQLELIELELDAKIAAAKLKASGDLTQTPEGISMPDVPTNLPKIDPPKSTEFNPELIAVYGTVNNLAAEMKNAGIGYTLRLGLGDIDGWKAKSIKEDEIVLTKDGKTKSIRLGYAESDQ